MTQNSQESARVKTTGGGKPPKLKCKKEQTCIRKKEYLKLWKNTDESDRGLNGAREKENGEEIKILKRGEKNPMT